MGNPYIFLFVQEGCSDLGQTQFTLHCIRTYITMKTEWCSHTSDFILYKYWCILGLKHWWISQLTIHRFHASLAPQWNTYYEINIIKLRLHSTYKGPLIPHTSMPLSDRSNLVWRCFNVLYLFICKVLVASSGLFQRVNCTVSSTLIIVFLKLTLFFCAF